VVEGVKIERERFAGLVKICGDDYQLLVESFVSETNMFEVRTMRIQRLSNELAKRKKMLSEQQVAIQGRSDSARIEFNNQPPVDSQQELKTKESQPT